MNTCLGRACSATAERRVAACRLQASAATALAQAIASDTATAVPPKPLCLAACCRPPVASDTVTGWAAAREPASDTAALEFVGQPMPACRQHHCFFQCDHSSSHWSTAASQSTWGGVVESWSQPQPTCSQHHAFCSRPQSCCHEPKQSYFRGPSGKARSGTPRAASARCEDSLPGIDDTSRSCLASSVARSRTTTGSAVGCSATLVVHPAPPWEAEQHHDFLPSDHSRRQFRTPAEQLNRGAAVVGEGAVVVEVGLVNEAGASS